MRAATNRARAQAIARWWSKDHPWRDPLAFTIERALDDAEARARAACAQVCDEAIVDNEQIRARLPHDRDPIGWNCRIIQAREIKAKIRAAGARR